MAAYVVVIREEPLQDEALYAEYQQTAAQNPESFPIKPLALNGKLDVLEGAAPDAAIILEFPTFEEAQRWYNSPGYQAAVVKRIASAKYRAFIVDGM